MTVLPRLPAPACSVELAHATLEPDPLDHAVHGAPEIDPVAHAFQLASGNAAPQGSPLQPPLEIFQELVSCHVRELTSSIALEVPAVGA